MINTDPNHKHTYDAQGNMTCCTLEEKIDAKTGKKNDLATAETEGNNHILNTREKAQLDQVKAGWVLTRTLIMSMLVLKTFFLFYNT